MKLKKLIAIALSATMMAGCVPVSANQMNVQTHSKEAIRSYVKNSKGKMNTGISYKQKPSTKSPYRAGELSSTTLNSALGIVIRCVYCRVDAT
jgi:hypothetical protein